MIARAADMAYKDAGIAPEDVDGAVSVEEDFVSGYSIADEYVPDQIGMVLKPIYTVPGDFLQGIGSAAMQIETGEFKTIVVEAYSKASNILNKDEMLHFALDPIFNRFGVSPHFLAGIEMQKFLAASDFDAGDVAAVAVRNRAIAAYNALSPYGGTISVRDVLNGRPVASPVTAPMIAKHSDAAVVAVLGIDSVAEERSRHPIYITGTGWNSGNSIIERRAHHVSEGTALAAQMACAEAGVENIGNEMDIVYVSDLYAHRQLMHLASMGISPDAAVTINPDGGSLGMGDLIDGNGGARFYDAVQQLRGEAGRLQVPDAERALVHGWRGVPTDTAAVTILDVERR